MTRLLCTSVLLGLLFGNVAGADPIAVRSGFVTFTDEPGGFSLAGRGFALQGEWYPSAVDGTFWYDRCQPCEPGALVDFGTTTYRFSRSDRSYGSSSAVIGGTVYSEVFLDAELTFSGPRVWAPLDGGPDFRPVSGPFTLAGHVAAYLDRSNDGPPVFSAGLYGSGTGYVWFGPSLFLHDVEYRFHDPDPVPEPSTLLLLATGLGLCAARLRTHRRA